MTDLINGHKGLKNKSLLILILKVESGKPEPLEQLFTSDNFISLSVSLGPMPLKVRFELCQT